MKLLPLMLLVTLFSTCVVFADSAASVKPLPFDDFRKIAGERSVAIDASARTAILDLAKGLDPIPPQLATVVESLRADAESISLEALMPLLESQRGQSVSQKIIKHDDPLVRFVAGIVLSGSGDTDAAKTVHALIHDESLSREKAGQRMLGDLIDKVYDGAAMSLVLQALSSAAATKEELEEVRRVLDQMEGKQS